MVLLLILHVVNTLIDTDSVNPNADGQLVSIVCMYLLEKVIEVPLDIEDHIVDQYHFDLSWRFPLIGQRLVRWCGRQFHGRQPELKLTVFPRRDNSRICFVESES